MTDFSYETARKTTRQHRTLSFNPQSSLKPTQQTNTHNKSFTKRKTPSKRYMNINESEINKTIDFSSFRTHHKTLSTGKQNQFIALPEIQIPKNKRGAKKGSYLQIWLNQALDQGQGNQNFLTSLNDQTLGALKKYGIDKKLLKGKNISQQTIDKIYKKLYVYSKGLGMTFQQIGKLATMKSPFEQNTVQGSGKQIIEVFWRAFSKIMQNETPYESAFQVMQKNYLKTIQELRLRMRGVGEQIQNIQKKHSEQKRKLQRQLQMLTIKYRQLQNEHKVNKSTLQLTDKTLDDQIQLRLKFQQKINSVYTSYKELKQKYADLVEQLGMKKRLNVKQQQSQCQLKQMLQRQQTKCRQMQHLLSLQQAKVRDLHTQIVIKKQQKADLQRQLLSNDQKVKKQQDELSQYNQKNKLLSSLLQQSHIQMTRLKRILQEQKQVNKKLQKRVEDLSELNDRLYEDKYRVYSEVEAIQERDQLLVKENNKKQGEINTLNSHIDVLNQQLQALNNQLKHTKNLNNDITYQLQIKTNLLEKANENMTKLKEIKDRHQRLHALAQIQRNQAINENVTLMSKLQQLQLQVQNLRNEILQKQQAAVIELTRFNKSKQFLTKKVIALEQQLKKKDDSLLTNLNTLQIERIMLLKKQREINEIKQKMQTRQHLIYKLQSQSVLLATNQPLIQELLKKKQQQLNKQTQKNLQNVLTENFLKSRIQQIQVLLNAKSSQVNIEIECYKRLSQSYKEMYDKRKQHVHPMVYEDLLMQLERMYRNVQGLNVQIQRICEQNDSVKSQYNQLSKENDKHKEEMIKAHQQIKTLKQSIETLHSQNDNLRKNLKEEINKSLLMLQQQKKLKGEISKLVNEKTLLQKKLQSSLNQSKQLRKQLQKKNEKIIKLEQINNQMNDKYQQVVKQNKEFKIKCADLQEKLLNSLTVKINYATQTEPIKVVDTQNLPNSLSNKSQRALVTPQESLQIIPNKLQNLQSKQITQTLLEHSLQPTVELKKKQKNQQLQKFINQTQKQSQVQKQKQKQKGPYTEKKKVQKGQFKRALKLTFMRR